MKCYYHPDREAVAVCSKCGKPLCKDCAIEYRGKIYCKNCMEKIKSEEKQKEKLSNQKKEEGKNISRIIITTVIISAIIIGIIIAISLTTGAPNRMKAANSKTNYIYTAPDKAEKEISIKVEADLCRVRILPLNDLIIKGKDYSNDLFVVTGNKTNPEVKFENNLLTVTYLPVFLHTEGQDKIISIYLSEKLKNIVLNVSNKTGSVYISTEIPITNAELFCKTGSMSLENCNIKNLTACVITGDFKLNKNRIENCKISLTTGNISLNENNKINKINIREVTGNFNLSRTTTIKNFVLSLVTGNSKIDFSGTASPATANIKTGLGNCTIITGNNAAKITIFGGKVSADPFFLKNGNIFEYNKSDKNKLDINITSAGNIILRR